ncbi:MAG: MFS transporter [Chitinophagales bacterium]|nr:MFS transporter [Chitinophagales bacterium]
MKSILAKYRKLDRFIVDLLIAEFFLQFVNAAFSMLNNFYMAKEGYHDYQIADFTFYRYLTVLLIALPFGIYIKGRRIKPWFYISTIGVPIMALFAIWAIHHHYDQLIKLSFSLWSGTYTFLQVAGLPFIMANSKEEHHGRSIALFFMMGNIATFICGSISFVLNHYYQQVFDVQVLLVIYSIIGLVGAYFIYRIKIKEHVSEKQPNISFHKDYDWGKVLQAIVPTIIISTGAGLTIQFISLFFLYVHGVQEDVFSLMNAVSFLFVALSVLVIPEIKDRFGYRVAIIWVQAIAVVFLILMASTEWYQHLWFAAPLAITFFLIRQPFMNVAGPVTSELTLNFVGKRNQQLLTAINSAIWSGCWAISSQIFAGLRSSNVHYSNILLTTAALYSLGVFWYHFLIKAHQRQLSKPSNHD